MFNDFDFHNNFVLCCEQLAVFISVLSNGVLCVLTKRSHFPVMIDPLKGVDLKSTLGHS